MSYNTVNYTEQGGAVTHFGGTVVFETGATVTGLSGDAIPTATTTVKGGVKVGAGLSVTEEGVLSANTAGTDSYGTVKQAANQADSTATTVAGLKDDFNGLLAKLKAAGLMAADAVVDDGE